MRNDEVAALLYEIADLLDLQGVAFKPQAYRRAARNIEEMDDDIDKLSSEGKLGDIPGVGDAMVKKIGEFLEKGKLQYLEDLRSEVPPGLVEIIRIPDVGPKTAQILYKELGIKSVDELKRAVLDHRLHGLKGFGEKTEERILQGIRTLETTGGRLLLGEALPVAEAYVAHMRSSLSIDTVSIAGSLRRGKETIGDIDILVGHDAPEKAMDAFTTYDQVDQVIMRGPTKSSARLQSGLQVDLRVVQAGSWGAALQYFTGSKEHNVTVRGMAIERGFKLNEYGLFERESGKLVAGETEESVYRALGLPLIPPELREDQGEIDAALNGKLPDLVEIGDIKGDLHVHTRWSDGSDDIEEIAASAAWRGYGYVAITDHSQSLRIANGLSREDLLKQVDAVRKAQETVQGDLRLLAGSEVDIKADGSLDFPQEVLRELDIVIGSVHSRFKTPKKEMTERVVKAIQSGIDILGHPTGRLIGQRAAYEVDIDAVLDAAKSSGVCLEVNCFPDRLDLSDAHCHMAKERGVRVALGTDSHSIEHMGNMRLGVLNARRGWLEPKDVLNTMDADALEGWLRSRRR